MSHLLDMTMADQAVKKVLGVAGCLLVIGGCGSPVTAAESEPLLRDAETAIGPKIEQGKEPEAASLEIHIEGLRGSAGNVVLAVYDNEQAFDQNLNPLAWVSVPAVSKTIALEGFPVGQVAITAFHDTNRNGEYDMLGETPLEGWGNSGDISKWSEPTFSDALADVGQISVHMHYYN